MSKILFSKVTMLSVLMILILSGCTIGFNTGAGSGTGASATDGGIYKSIDKGTSWVQKVLIQTVGVKRSFATVDMITLAMDPQDNKAIYASGVENGLLYSYDGGESWQVAASLGKINVTNIAVDPANKCVIYVTAANRVFKSMDCSRTWTVVYFDNDPSAAITALVIDFSNNKNVFMGTSRGEIIKSSDQGGSWQTLNRFNSRVDKIAINPVNPNVMFVGAYNKGFFRSTDGGVNWTDLSDKLASFGGGRSLRDFVMVKADKPTLFLANNYDLIKSTDDGDTWSKIELIIEKARIKINALAVNPSNLNEIYYVTDTTFYRSLDGGKNWSSKKLPTSRIGLRLMIDSKNPTVLYLATKQVKKQ